MIRKLLLFVLLALPSVCLADVRVSILNGHTITMPQPKTVTLANGALFLKYDGWYFYQVNIDPTRVYPSVDLSGVLAEYFETVFDPDECKNLPAKWLCTLAKEQAKSFHINANNLKHWEYGGISFYAFYNANNVKGDIFSIYKSSVQRLEITGSKGEFISLVKMLHGGSHGTNQGRTG